MNSDDYIDRIEDYVTGQMSELEKQGFEQEQKDNPELADAVKKYRIAREAMDLMSEQAMKTQFKEWREEEGGIVLSSEAQEIPLRKKGLLSGRRRRQLSVAASFLLLFSLLFYFLIDRFLVSDPLFVSFQNPMPVERIMGPQDVAFEEAIEAYQNKNYDRAIRLFQAIDPPTDFTEFYLGHSLFLAEDYPAAESRFRSLIDRADTALKEEAEWGLLATLYYSGDKAEAFDTLLSRIAADERHSFCDEARGVKARLEAKRKE